MDSRESRILVATCYGHFMSHFNMLVFPAVVLPLANRLNMSMGYILDLSFWMYHHMNTRLSAKKFAEQGLRILLLFYQRRAT